MNKYIKKINLGLAIIVLILSVLSLFKIISYDILSYAIIPLILLEAYDIYTILKKKD